MQNNGQSGAHIVHAGKTFKLITILECICNDATETNIQLLLPFFFIKQPYSSQTNNKKK